MEDDSVDAPVARRPDAPRALRVVLGGLAVMDLWLGLVALVFPETYVGTMHPEWVGFRGDGLSVLVRRTGMLWLGFAVVQGIAALDPAGRPAWVLVAGTFRLLDVPADGVYFLSAGSLSTTGWYGLLLAPVFNLVVGVWFAGWGYRLLDHDG